MPPTGQRVTSNYNTADVALPTATETVISTIGGISTWAPDNVVRLQGWTNVSAGASVTAVTLRIRRSGLTGVLVGELVGPNVVASTVNELTIYAEETPGDVAGLPYVLTATLTGGSGFSLDAELVATVG